MSFFMAYLCAFTVRGQKRIVHTPPRSDNLTPNSTSREPPMFRRTALCLLLIPPVAHADEPRPQPRSEVTMTDEALKIHREALLIDGHNDLPYQYREKKDLSFASIDIARPQPALHTDIPRLRQGGVGAQFWA